MRIVKLHPVTVMYDYTAMQFSESNGTRACEPAARIKVYKVSGADGGGATPVPIPNTAVKPTNADGTETAGSTGE